MTSVEASADYPAKVAAYLAKSGGRRLPWGHLVAGGHLVQTVTSKEIRDRHELGEIAIELLLSQGITIADLEALNSKQEKDQSCTTETSPEPTNEASPT